jgi:energy-converting hydrogenase Eha subunit A
MFRTLIISLVMAGIVISIALIISVSRRGATAAQDKPRRIQSFETSVTPSAVLHAITTLARRSGYKIAFVDETKGSLVLSDSVSLTSFGFFYPVFATPQGGGQTLVEVGIKKQGVAGRSDRHPSPQ